MKYSSIVGQRDGQLFPGRREKKEFYPSIMRSHAPLDDGQEISLGAKAALFTSVAMKQGQNMGFRTGKTFSYHLKDPRIDRHRRNFEKIVKQLKEALGKR